MTAVTQFAHHGRCHSARHAVATCNRMLLAALAAAWGAALACVVVPRRAQRAWVIAAACPATCLHASIDAHMQA